jgi:hypothetical protein
VVLVVELIKIFTGQQTCLRCKQGGTIKTVVSVSAGGGWW